MKKSILLIACLSMMIGVFSQELTITNPFHENPTDRDALTNKVYDNNHELCALVKVGFDDLDATFIGDVISQEFGQGVWWVYLREGCTSMMIETCDNSSILIDFSHALIGGVSYGVDLGFRSINLPVPKEVLTKEDVDEINQQIEMKVSVFQGFVSDLASDQLSKKAKEKIRDNALILFIGEGNPFTILIPLPNGKYEEKMHKPVQMGIFTSKYNPRRKYFLMKDYLTNLINSKYKKVIIENAQGLAIDKNFRKVSEGRYMTVVHYLQKYTAFSSTDLKRPTYWDLTEKTITIYIDRHDIILPDGEVGHFWEVKLGDVDCDDIYGD